ncbi:MAG TPA: hypothetical protein VF752_11500 [Thermoleophilaceae bacterium]
MDREVPNGLFARPVLHYVAMLTAARDFGLSTPDIDAIVHRFPDPAPSDELADALADAILSRA